MNSPLTEMNIGICGRYKAFATCSLTGKVRELTPWFDNLILNAGVNRLFAGSSVKGTMVVGTGTNAPARTDTQLQTLKATSTSVTETNSAQSTAPWFSTYTATFSFAVGAATGVLSEVGFGWAATGLFSRSLFKDVFGAAAPITVLANEALSVKYEFRVYPPATDTTVQLTTSSVTYTLTTRAANVANANAWTAGSILDGIVLPVMTNAQALFGSLGAIDGQPGGAAASISSATVGWNAAYVANSFTRRFDIGIGSPIGNPAGGVNVLYIPTRGTTLPYQYSFSPTVAKDINKTLNMGFQFTLILI